MRFGEALRQARKSAGFTLQRAADLLGCSVAYLSDVELGHRKPLGSAQIVTLCNKFGIDPKPLMKAAADEGRGVTIRSESSAVMEAAMGLARGDLPSGDLEKILAILREAGKK